MDFRLRDETITLEPQDWDSEVLGLRAAKLTFSAKPSKDYQPLVELLKSSGFEYVTARIPLSERERAMALTAAGFRQIDSIVTFAIEGPAKPPESGVRLATAVDAERVGELAAESFTLSRYFTDPILSQAQGRRAMSEWGRNSCKGKAADAVWIVEEKSQIAGFITCKKRGKTGVIVLVAVRAQSAGKGIGAQLVRQACKWFLDQGIHRVEVQTQSENTAAIQLYSKEGFSEFSRSITLRWSAK
jgi:ribosomal protein S18 acetylase RimI-like enzyme